MEYLTDDNYASTDFFEITKPVSSSNPGFQYRKPVSIICSNKNSIETQNNHTIFKVSGDVTANEITLQAVRYMSGEQTDTSPWDFTRTGKVKISTTEIQGIADSLKRVSTKGKVRKVALVGSKNVNIGLSKRFAAFAQLAGLPDDYTVFRDMDHAMERII